MLVVIEHCATFWPRSNQVNQIRHSRFNFAASGLPRLWSPSIVLL